MSHVNAMNYGPIPCLPTPKFPAPKPAPKPEIDQDALWAAATEGEEALKRFLAEADDRFQAWYLQATPAEQNACR